MAKYQVQAAAHNANYRLMSATADIYRGEEILAEVPLASLKVGLSNIYEPLRFFSKNTHHNGAKHLERMRDSLPPGNWARLSALFNKDPNGSLTDLVATNAFGDDDEIEGQTWTVLRIYDEISRVNHSCLPNAAVDYDMDRGLGVLRALTPIPNGTEIFINYLYHEGNCLVDRSRRVRTLRDAYGFDCNCAICGLDGHARADNDNERIEALKEYKKLHKPYEPRVRWQSESSQRTTKLTAAQNYVNLLNGLGMVDGKLGWAYRKVADIHEELYEIARNSVPAGTNHCPDCANHGRSWHLDRAKDACDKALAIDITAYGGQSGQVAETQRQIMNIMSDRLREP